MSDFPSLAEVLGKHTQMCGSFLWSCECGVDWDENRDITHAEHQADAWREACTIRTVEQLLVFPAGGVIHTERDGAIEKFSDGHWYLPARRDAVSLQRVLDNLPALLIWHPDWTRP